MADLTLVTGGGGFIGAHLVRRLVADNARVRAVDLAPLDCWQQVSSQAENVVGDLSDPEVCDQIMAGASRVYNLAADMGGMGFIAANRARCMLSVLINTHLLQAAFARGVDRFFFASSACIYPIDRQLSPSVTPLRESDAYPPNPEDGYGWEKLFSERMCRHFTQDFALSTRIARYHNVYGPYTTWAGGREKAPAAICRKVAEAKLLGGSKIEVWGDGEQTRSFTYIDDCIDGTCMLMDSGFLDPVNLGSAELVTINELVDIVEEIAGTDLNRHYNRDAPLGVRGRNSDNTLVRAVLGWEPSVRLRDGLADTYQWIHDQVARRAGSKISCRPALVPQGRGRGGPQGRSAVARMADGAGARRKRDEPLA